MYVVSNVVVDFLLHVCFKCNKVFFLFSTRTY